jgi:hypothetical protein
VPSKIIGYGERGVINFLSTDIIRENKETEFLQSIIWTGEKKPEWINNEIREHTFIVERA